MANIWTEAQDVRWSGSFIHTEEDKHLDKDGNPLMNTAEQPYVQRQLRTYPTIICSWYINRDYPLLRGECAGRAVNENTLWGFTAKKLWLYRWDVKYYVRHFQSGGDADSPIISVDRFVWNELEFAVNHDTWTVDHPEFGTRILDDDQGTTPESRYEHVTMPAGFPTDDTVIIPANPVKLTAAGLFAGAAAAAKTSTETFFVFDFEVFKHMGASDIKLPENMPSLP